MMNFDLQGFVNSPLKQVWSRRLSRTKGSATSMSEHAYLATGVSAAPHAPVGVRRDQMRSQRLGDFEEAVSLV